MRAAGGVREEAGVCVCLFCVVCGCLFFFVAYVRVPAVAGASIKVGHGDESVQKDIFVVIGLQ